MHNILCHDFRTWSSSELEKERINAKVNHLDDGVYVSLFIVHNQIPSLILYKLNDNNDTISGDGESANFQKSYDINPYHSKKCRTNYWLGSIYIQLSKNLNNRVTVTDITVTRDNRR